MSEYGATVNKFGHGAFVRVVQLDRGKDLPLPSYGTRGAAGMDLRSAVEVDIVPGQYALIPTGIKIALPPNFELQIRPRSGLALKHGITCLNAPGTIDEDYRGEIGVILINHGHTTFTVNYGDRIAQAVMAPVWRVVWDAVDNLDDTDRGEGGFGSTGKG